MNEDSLTAMNKTKMVFHQIYRVYFKLSAFSPVFNKNK